MDSYRVYLIFSFISCFCFTLCFTVNLIYQTTVVGLNPLQMVLILVEGSFPFFGAIVAAQVLWGLGPTFGSGAKEAWIADELGEDRVG